MKARAMMILALLSLAACEKAKQDMYDQPKYEPMEASPLWENGTSARPLPEGTVPHAMGPFSGTSSGRIGEEAVAETAAALRAQTNPYPVTMQLLKRGQERYTIYCMPCHSPVGDGDGWIARRGFPHPPSYHTDRLRKVPDRHIFDVITNGYGIMYSYADRIEPPDRWAIVAYIRVLQSSQNAHVASLPPDMRAYLGQSDDRHDALLPLQGRGREGDGLSSRDQTHPHPIPPLEGEGIAKPKHSESSSRLVHDQEKRDGPLRALHSTERKP